MKRILFAVLLIVAVFVAVFVFLPAAPVSVRCDITSSKCTGPVWDGVQPTVPPPPYCVGHTCKPVEPEDNGGKHRHTCAEGPKWCTKPLPFDQAH